MKKITLCGSMKFRSVIKTTMQKLEKIGLKALFPNIDYSTEDKDVALTLDEKKKLALAHYSAIAESDAVYFILPEGYMGTSCKLELGYALALKKPIYFSEPTNDIGLDCYPEKIIAIEDIEILVKDI